MNVMSRMALFAWLPLMMSCTGNQPAVPEVAVTVGRQGEYPSISSALKADPVPEVLWILDPVHREFGIIVETKVTILGAGAGRTRIQGGTVNDPAGDRIFQVRPEGELIVRDVGLTGGYSRATPLADAAPRYPGDTGQGGAILNRGVVVLERCLIAENTASHGGALWNSGRMDIVDTVIRSNRTIPPTAPESLSALGCRGSGGAIKNEKPGILSITDSSICGNHSVRRGGGLFVSCESQAKLENVLISGNHADREGGGIYLRGDLELSNCTLTWNESTQAGSGLANSGRLSLKATLLAKNGHEDYRELDGGWYGSGDLTEVSESWVADGSLGGARSGWVLLGPLLGNDAQVPRQWSSAALGRIGAGVR